MAEGNVFLSGMSFVVCRSSSAASCRPLLSTNLVVLNRKRSSGRRVLANRLAERAGEEDDGGVQQFTRLKQRLLDETRETLQQTMGVDRRSRRFGD